MLAKVFLLCAVAAWAFAPQPPRWEFGKEVTSGDAAVTLIPNDPDHLDSSTFSVVVRGEANGADHAIVLAFHYRDVVLTPGSKALRLMLHEEHMAPVARELAGMTDPFHLTPADVEFIRVEFYRQTDVKEFGR